MEQELLTLPHHLCSSPGLCGFMYCMSFFVLFLLTIVLNVLLWCTVSYYLFGIFWPLYCMFFFDVLFFITSFASFDHCIECPSLMYCFLLPLWYLLTIVLNVLLWCTVSYYLICIFWPLYCMSFFDVLFLITSLVSFDHCIVCPSLMYCFLLPLWYLLTIVLHVLLWRTVSYYLFGIFWPLYCMSFFDVMFLITSFVSFDHCIECPSLMYCFLLPLWYLLTIVLYVLLWCTVSYYLFCIFWPLYWMSFFDVLFLITSLVSFDHCIVCPSLMYCFLLPLWYLFTIVLCVLLWCTVCYYLFGIF